MKEIAIKAGVGIGALLFGAIVFAVLVALPTMLLWNWLAPDIIPTRNIDFLEAVGILFLAKILFHQGD